jgi:predicted alpha/beta hydrolase
VRRLLTFPCEGATLGATLDAADAKVGVLFAVGGAQTRIGSHRMFERLSKSLAEHGHAAFRFDRRGVGDSAGATADRTSPPPPRPSAARRRKSSG